MELLPCKKDKCISYPACISKVVVCCPTLYSWIESNGHTEGRWAYIEKHLTSIKLVRHHPKYGRTYVGKEQFSFKGLTKYETTTM